MSKLVSLSDLADEINAAWQKTREGILETARLCAEANRLLAALLQLIQFKFRRK
jgi:hypothetical protein